MRRRTTISLLLSSILGAASVSADIYDDFVQALEPIAAIIAAVFGLQWADGIPRIILVKALFVILWITLIWFASGKAFPAMTKNVRVTLAIVLGLLAGLVTPDAWYNIMNWLIKLFILIVILSGMFYLSHIVLKPKDEYGNSGKAGVYIVRFLFWALIAFVFIPLMRGAIYG